MFSYGYSQLGDIDKLSLAATASSEVLMRLIDTEIETVKIQLCSITISVNLITEYTIVQQRLIALKDLKEFLEQVQKDTFNPPSE